MGPDVAVLDTKEGVTMSDLPKDGEGEKAPANDAMTLEQVTEMLKGLAPKVAELTAAFAAMGKPAEPKVEIEDAPKDIPPAAMDAAINKVLAQIGQRDELAQQLSQHIGVFDHKAMSLEQVVNYGCEKLNLRKDAGVLEGYLKAAPRPAQDRAVSFVSAADAATGADPIAAYLGGK